MSDINVGPDGIVRTPREQAELTQVEEAASTGTDGPSVRLVETAREGYQKDLGAWGSGGKKDPEMKCASCGATARESEVREALRFGRTSCLSCGAPLPNLG